MTITRATSADAGCYVDGHWGQYAISQMILRATDFGYDDDEIIDLAKRHLATMMPSDVPELSDDEYETLTFAADDTEQWLNENVAPEGFSFGWYEGEFFLQSEGWWAE